MSKPFIIKGDIHIDSRGALRYNNDFQVQPIKRIYTITNSEDIIYRGWQGHKIENRWFAAVGGAVEIQVIKIDNWQNPDIHLPMETYVLENNGLDVLFVPKGHITSLKCGNLSSTVLVMSDYGLGETNDDYRFEPDYFKENR
jgi:hypothetical protein